MKAAAQLPPHDLTKVSLVRFVAYFLKLGTFGFGGPIALAGYMQQDLVDAYGWVSREDYLEGLALAQLAPGPLAAQLAIYLGYLQAGVLGATLVAIAFVLPSFLMVLALSAAYVRYGGLSWMQGMFYGVGAAVIAIIARSAYKLTKLTLGKDWLLWTIFVVLAVSTAWTSRESILLVLLGGIVMLIAKAFPRDALSPGKLRMQASLFLAALTLPATGVLGEIFFTLRRQGCWCSGAGLPSFRFFMAAWCRGITGSRTASLWMRWRWQ